MTSSTHWHGATSVPGPVDPSGCCAEATPNRTEKVALSEPENEHDGCDCTELCSMGPTCPGGMLARLPGSGCWRTEPTAASIAAEFRAQQETEAAERLAKGLRGERE